MSGSNTRRLCSCLYRDLYGFPDLVTLINFNHDFFTVKVSEPNRIGVRNENYKNT